MGAAGLYWRHGLGIYLRRHLLLLVIGLAHFALLWHGDIIASYAQVALLLPLWLRRSPSCTALTLWAVGLGLLYFIPTFWAALAMNWSAPRYGFSPQFEEHQSYLSILRERLHDLPSDSLLGYPYDIQSLAGGLLFAGFFLLYFLLGAAMQKSGLLARPQQHQVALRRLAFWGLGLGVPLGVLLAWMNAQTAAPYTYLSESVRMVGGLLMALGYIGLFGLISLGRSARRLLPLAYSGRMAMSNYIAQSLVMTTLFYPYTFGLYGHVGAAGAVAFALAFGVLQVALSRLYLAHFPRGPLETLVRWAVYGRS
ncbi:DUF418 domain-containing protein [Deinococcus lacus]|uniref:DUF418 domain-containing protein n=1 Tax=Deinococcus lacus TaxID=392561 RepID=A0ABW1YFG3_9DEIO